MDAGADVNGVDEDGFTPLHYAAKRNMLFTGRLLLYRGARADAKDGHGWTPLHQAAFAPVRGLSSGQDPTCEASSAAEDEPSLLAEMIRPLGVDVNAKDTMFGQTPLHAAVCQNGKRREVETLIASGAEVNAVDGAGRTSLHWAASAGSVCCIRILLGAGAKVDARDVQDKTPLNYALQNGRACAVRELIENGAAY